MWLTRWIILQRLSAVVEVYIGYLFASPCDDQGCSWTVKALCWVTQQKPSPSLRIVLYLTECAIQDERLMYFVDSRMTMFNAAIEYKYDWLARRTFVQLSWGFLLTYGNWSGEGQENRRPNQQQAPRVASAKLV